MKLLPRAEKGWAEWILSLLLFLPFLVSGGRPSPRGSYEVLSVQQVERHTALTSMEPVDSIRFRSCHWDPRDLTTGDSNPMVNFLVRFDVCTVNITTTTNSSNGRDCHGDHQSCMARSASVADYLRWTVPMVQSKYQRVCPVCQEQCEGCDCQENFSSCNCGESFPGDVCCRFGCCISNNCNCGQVGQSQGGNKNNNYNYSPGLGGGGGTEGYNSNSGNTNSYTNNFLNDNRNSNGLIDNNGNNGQDLEEGCLEKDSFLDTISQSCTLCLRECDEILGDTAREGLPSISDQLATCMPLAVPGGEQDAMAGDTTSSGILYVGPYCAPGGGVERGVFLDEECQFLHPAMDEEWIPPKFDVPPPELEAAMNDAIGEYAELLHKTTYPMSCEGDMEICQEINEVADHCEVVARGNDAVDRWDCSGTPPLDMPGEPDDGEAADENPTHEEETGNEQPPLEEAEDALQFSPASLSFDSCVTQGTSEYVLFRLCSEEDSNLCDQQFVCISEYVSSTTESQLRVQNYFCAVCEQECTENGEDLDGATTHAQLTDCGSCVDVCAKVQNMEENGYIDASEFSFCQMINDLDDGNALFAGPVCAGAGTKIDIGVFSDEECLEREPEARIDDYLMDGDGFQMKLSYALLKTTYAEDSPLSCFDLKDSSGELQEQSGLCVELMENSLSCSSPAGYDCSGEFISTSSVCGVLDETEIGGDLLPGEEDSPPDDQGETPERL